MTGSHYRVYKDAVRSWRPEQYASEDRMLMVLEILEQEGDIEQSEIVTQMYEQLSHLQRSTVAGIVTASMLWLVESGFVEVVAEGRSTTWRLRDE